MKKIILVALLLPAYWVLFAQDTLTVSEAPERRLAKHSFKKENLFTGGNINLSFFNGSTVLGGTPHFGYSLTRWLDVALSFNYTYISQRDDFNNKVRQNLFAPGVFVRAFPINFLFVHAQYEHSFVTQKYLPAAGSGGIADKYKYQVNSLLIGPGYSSGRENGNNSFGYISVLFDVLQQPGSPYTDRFGNIIPFISAGFNIGLFQGGGGNSSRQH
jgi:hypothetical protein